MEINLSKWRWKWWWWWWWQKVIGETLVVRSDKENCHIINFHLNLKRNIATGETSQAITPFHFFDNFYFTLLWRRNLGTECSLNVHWPWGLLRIWNKMGGWKGSQLFSRNIYIWKLKLHGAFFPLDLFLICHCVVPSLYFPYPYLCCPPCVVCHVTQRALIGPNILTCVSDQFQCKVCSQEERKSVSVPSVEHFNFSSSASVRNAHNWSSLQIDILSMITWFSFPYFDFEFGV